MMISIVNTPERDNGLNCYANIIRSTVFEHLSTFRFSVLTCTSNTQHLFKCTQSNSVRVKQRQQNIKELKEELDLPKFGHLNLKN